MNNNFNEIEKKINYIFKNKKLLEMALTHKSYTNEMNLDASTSNERLEFLGDAIADLITAEYLYNKYKFHNEGVLTKIQAQVISTKSFSKISKQLGLGNYLRLSKGENLLAGYKKPSLLADAFEALIGAIYLDSDIQITKKIILPFLKDSMSNFETYIEQSDFKTKLQEIVQYRYKNLPEYVMVDNYGPDHDKIFQVSVYVNNKKLGTGFGSTKKEAQKVAAKQALEKIDESE